eukprot:TRINITY_DN9232_c0_g1_i2.p1 TRINITY_DN9232_c0_g1~~TRINITY_DN9232_c0_g1_i2.p1  ORF type:complete len:213 (+),score=26.26 TRINITY_DN9232_c0_g1_i2:29-640(+)
MDKGRLRIIAMLLHRLPFRVFGGPDLLLLHPTGYLGSDTTLTLLRSLLKNVEAEYGCFFGAIADPSASPQQRFTALHRASILVDSDAPSLTRWMRSQPGFSDGLRWQLEDSRRPTLQTAAAKLAGLIAAENRPLKGALYALADTHAFDTSDEVQLNAARQALQTLGSLGQDSRDSQNFTDEPLETLECIVLRLKPQGLAWKLV